MEGFGVTVVLVLVDLFLLYKTGVMGLVQDSMETGSTVANRKLGQLDVESQYNDAKFRKKMKRKANALNDVPSMKSISKQLAGKTKGGSND